MRDEALPATVHITRVWRITEVNRRFNVAGQLGGGILNQGNAVLNLENATIGDMVWNNITGNTPDNLATDGGTVNPGEPLVGVPGDLDADADVDVDDYVLLAQCLVGPNQPPQCCLPPSNGDLDGDNDSDLADFGNFAQFLVAHP